jgi:chromosome segregation ATPase
MALVACVADFEADLRNTLTTQREEVLTLMQEYEDKERELKALKRRIVELRKAVDSTQQRLKLKEQERLQAARPPRRPNKRKDKPMEQPAKRPAKKTPSVPANQLSQPAACTRLAVAVPPPEQEAELDGEELWQRVLKDLARRDPDRVKDINKHADRCECRVAQSRPYGHCVHSDD